jgi:hypothetical protein
LELKTSTPAAGYPAQGAKQTQFSVFFTNTILYSMPRITNGFEKLSLAVFRKKVDLIVANMTDNVNFPGLQPDVQDLAIALAAYKLLDDAAAGRDGQAILKRDIARVALTDQLHLLGNDVTSVAKNNVEMMASSGFNYTQPRKNSPNMTKPAPPTLKAGVNGGEISCRTSKQPGMTGVNYYITADTTALGATDGTGWEVVSINKVKYTFDSLVSGQRYYVKVGLVGVRNQEVFSDHVSYIPQ